MAGTRGSQERPRATPDDYIFGKLIGEGSFSTVFLAKDVKSDREYAIKVRQNLVTCEGRGHFKKSLAGLRQEANPTRKED